MQDGSPIRPYVKIFSEAERREWEAANCNTPPPKVNAAAARFWQAHRAEKLRVERMIAGRAAKKRAAAS